MKLDVLAFGSHPDDVEMSCGGTIAKLVAEGKKVGVVDLTRGELGTRGSAEIRDAEAEAAAKILGLAVRENLKFRDAFFAEDDLHLQRIIYTIRKYQPSIVLGNALKDRHPDHGKGANLVRNACFMSGLPKIVTMENDMPQHAWRPKLFLTYIQDYQLCPDLVVDITDFFETKIHAIGAYASQFYNPNSTEPETYISTFDFWKFLEARSRNVGHLIGTTYGEGFQSEIPLKVSSLLDLV